MNILKYWKSTKFRQLAGLALAFMGPQSWAEQSMPAQQEYFHGFASVGYIATTGNNFYGETLHGGDVDYYEAGLNGFAQLHPNLSVSGQILSRKAGATDDGKLRLDYGFFDLRLNQNASSLGLRAGRVRNPVGFYNESRDVVFTRPSILLPQSAYLEGTGIRELLFASDGLQLYGDWDQETSHTTFELNLVMDENVSRQTRKNFTNGLSGISVDRAKLKHPIFAQIMHEMDGGRERLALSYFDALFDGTISLGNLGFPFTLRSKQYVLSGQYNAENWSLTSEYTLTSTEQHISGLSSSGRSDGIYLQFQYRFTPEWTGLLRQDVYYLDRNDRSNNVYKDSTIGLNWAFQPEWLLSTEYHQIAGTGGIPAIDNPDTTPNLSPHTRLLAVVLGYRF